MKEQTTKSRWKVYSDGWKLHIKRKHGTDIDFFPYNLRYAFSGIVYPPKEQESPVKDSRGHEREYKVFGVINMFIQDKEVNLTVYDIGTKELFLPFVDAHDQTYKGGRYVEVDRPDDKGRIIVDFNFAYNPLCLYSERYACPIPPIENKLEIPIPAGMRKKAYPKGVARFLRSLIE